MEEMQEFVDEIKKEENQKKQNMKNLAVEAMEESKLAEVFDQGELYKVDMSAGAALKAVLADKAVDYAMRAMKLAKKKGIKCGAAAVIIVAKRDRL